MQDIRLLQQIHQSAEMGKVDAENALRNTNDPIFRKALHAQHRKYQEIYGTAANYLIARGIPPKSASPIRRFNSMISTARYHSPSDLAGSIIRNETTNLNKSTQLVQNYKGHDPLVLALAKDLKRADEQSIDQMKTFL